MLENFKIYFSQIEILSYWIFSLSLLAYTYLTGYFLQYWYLYFIVILLSPFIEYFTHLYFLHLPMPQKTDTKIKEFYELFLEHIHHYHHKDPKNINFIFAQIWLTIPALFIYTGIVYLLTKSIGMTLVISNSIIFYYLFYELCHFTAHSGYTPKTKYFQYMKKYHILHHYKNENYWYGITNPLGDFIFGRYKNPDLVEKSLTAKNIS